MNDTNICIIFLDALINWIQLLMKNNVCANEKFPSELFMAGGCTQSKSDSSDESD